jgi:hypothetical protein
VIHDWKRWRDWLNLYVCPYCIPDGTDRHLVQPSCFRAHLLLKHPEKAA